MLNVGLNHTSKTCVNRKLLTLDFKLIFLLVFKYKAPYRCMFNLVDKINFKFRLMVRLTLSIKIH